MQQNYRVALVGTGGIARAHATACSLTDQADLVAVCDVSPDALDRFTQQFDVPQTYTDLDAMLHHADIDIAIICTWGVFHTELGIQIAESKQVRAILCEKPFTQTATEALALVAAGHKNNILVAEAFKFRHHPMHLRAKEILDQGGIGDLLAVRSTFCTNAPAYRLQPALNWRYNRSKGGGAIYDLACYNVHQARFVFGEEPQIVFAAQMPGAEVDISTSISLVFSGGRTAQISVSFSAWQSQYVEMVGTHGMLRMDRAWNNENQPVVLEHHTADEIRHFKFKPVHQFVFQLEHLCTCLDGNTPHRIPPEHSIAQMRVLDAIAESMNTGKAVEL
ncbi:MAG: Gfo/Idh/MocA family oxidoreductase [Chloroflexota bacterium]